MTTLIGAANAAMQYKSKQPTASTRSTTLVDYSKHRAITAADKKETPHSMHFERSHNSGSKRPLGRQVSAFTLAAALDKVEKLLSEAMMSWAEDTENLDLNVGAPLQIKPTSTHSASSTESMERPCCCVNRNEKRLSGPNASIRASAELGKSLLKSSCLYGYNSDTTGADSDAESVTSVLSDISDENSFADDDILAELALWVGEAERRKTLKDTTRVSFRMKKRGSGEKGELLSAGRLKSSLEQMQCNSTEAGVGDLQMEDSLLKHDSFNMNDSTNRLDLPVLSTKDARSLRRSKSTSSIRQNLAEGTAPSPAQARAIRSPSQHHSARSLLKQMSSKRGMHSSYRNLEDTTTPNDIKERRRNLRTRSKSTNSLMKSEAKGAPSPQRVIRASSFKTLSLGGKKPMLDISSHNHQKESSLARIRREASGRTLLDPVKEERRGNRRRRGALNNSASATNLMRDASMTRRMGTKKSNSSYNLSRDQESSASCNTSTNSKGNISHGSWKKTKKKADASALHALSRIKLISVCRSN